MNAIKNLYENNRGFSSIGGMQLFIFLVLSGVLQGCPLSGSLFVICMDPLLNMFAEYIQNPSRSQIRACADDVGAALQRLSQLHILFKLFSEIEKAAGLTLKPAKCVIVLLACEANSDTRLCLGEATTEFVTSPDETYAYLGLATAEIV